ncbi:MAG: multidrug DMT transporter permease [Planctomycetia bacterium]
MMIIHSFPVAVALCVVTMLCWGSWANTQKLAGRAWPFQLYDWDYSLGVLLLAVVSAFTCGSLGTAGRPFLADLAQAAPAALGSALLGGAIFNLSNILLVAAIGVAGMAVAFPVGVGLALVIGVATSYMAKPVGNPLLICLGVLCIMLAIVLDALAYRRLAHSAAAQPRLGMILSVAAGVLMGFFYRFVVAAMATDFADPEAGKLGPYAAIAVFSAGLFLSSFLWNTLVMLRPFVGEPVSFREYFTGSPWVHGVGILGGVIWNVGMSLSILASDKAGPAVSYGLGQGATMVAALWGVFVWREFAAAPAGTGRLLTLMFLLYGAGLALLIAAR